MKLFDLKNYVANLNQPSIIFMLQAIEANKGKTFDLPSKTKLNRLHDLNKRRSVTSSNEIEGISISSRREEDVLLNNMAPETKEEFLLFGYNKALERIFDVYEYQTLDESFVLDLHYLMYESFSPDFGGKYKTQKNYIKEFLADGKSRTIFIPAKPEDITSLMGNLIWQFNECANDPTVNKLVLVFVFALDFLCIHPFADGNGRISRLLTSFLLLKFGYDIDKYYSISYSILQNLDRYYSTLEKSSNGWHDNANDYQFFVLFMLEMTKKSYEKLAYMVKVNSLKTVALEKVEKIIKDSFVPISKGDIEEILFNLTKTTIEKALGELVKGNKIQLVQSGHYASYYKK